MMTMEQIKALTMMMRELPSAVRHARNVGTQAWRRLADIAIQGGFDDADAVQIAIAFQDEYVSADD